MKNVWMKVVWVATVILVVGFAGQVVATDQEDPLPSDAVAVELTTKQADVPAEKGEMPMIPALGDGSLDWAPMSNETCSNGFIVPSGCNDPAGFCACEAGPDHIMCCVHEYCDPNCRPPHSAGC